MSPNAFGWPKEKEDGTVIWASGARKLLPQGECPTCDSYRENHGGPDGFYPSHDGSTTCYGMPFSIAKAGPEGHAHCTCDGCW